MYPPPPTEPEPSKVSSPPEETVGLLEEEYTEDSEALVKESLETVAAEAAEAAPLGEEAIEE